MQLDYFQRLFEFNYWANDKILLVVGSLHEADSGILGTFGHILAAGQIWNARLHGTSEVGIELWPKFSKEECQDKLELDRATFEKFFNTLSPAELDREIHYVNSKGIAYRNSVGDILGHVVNHATHHRAQILLRSKELGGPPLNLDFITFTRRH